MFVVSVEDARRGFALLKVEVNTEDCALLRIHTRAPFKVMLIKISAGIEKSKEKRFRPQGLVRYLES